MSYSRVITLAAIATLVVAVLAVPRRSAVLPALDENTTSEGTGSPAQAIVAVKSVAAPSALAPVATQIAKPGATTHPERETVKNAPAVAVQNPVAATSKKPAILSADVDTHATTPSDGSRSGNTPAAVTVPASASPATETHALSPVTITGCLETSSSKDRFRLTDTEGANAPKSRSWRTGFLTKHSSTVDLVGAPDVGALQKQVGRRVAVTGVQTNRELKVGSVRVVSPSCN